MSTSFIGMLGTSELVLILAIVVVVFGVGKLPQVGRQLGEGIRNFKKEMGSDAATDPPPELPAASPAAVARDVTQEHQQKA